MAIVQISRIQVRRGLDQDLPTLASGEMAWSTDVNKLYIGNGTAAEGAPLPGQQTEVLTEYSILDFTSGVTGNITALESNVSILQSNVTSLTAQIGTVSSVALSVGSGILANITANNATISYTLSQGSNQRTGTIHMSRYAGSSTVSYDEEYNESNGTTDIVFAMSANTTRANLTYTTSTATSLLYKTTYLS